MANQQQTISADDLQYLVLEGGGGAGNAFPGALMALEDLGIMGNDGNKPQGVKGFAGSSAGAITALFLSLGYNSYELNYILTNQDFTEFFDDIKISFVPRIGGCRMKANSEYITGEQQEIASSKSLGDALLGFIEGRLLLYLVSPILASLPINYETVAESIVFNTAKIMTAKQPSQHRIVEQVQKGAEKDELYLSLKYDWGIFSGDAIRKFFAKWTYVAVYRALNMDPDVGENIYINNTKINPSELTFAQHKAIFGVDLIITGSNLETGKTEYFSHYTTPKFPVVDAARISMSLPGAYKPMVLRSNQPADAAAGITKGSFMEGVWVDGGLFNNDPVGAFDMTAKGFDRTLSLRLRVDEHPTISDYKGFYGAWPFGMAMGTGESQISTSLSPYLKRTLELDVKQSEMGLFDFSVSQSVFEKVNQRSYKSVMSYFNDKQGASTGFTGDWNDSTFIGDYVAEYAQYGL